MARFAAAAGTIENFLRTMPGPMYSEVSPRRVFEDAHRLYSATCSKPVEIGEFIDHLWGRGLTVEQVGARYWLKLPGRDRTWAERNTDTPTRIA